MSFVGLGGALGFLAVAMGAFGAHALRGRLTPDLHTVYQTAVLYHLVHALALALCGVLARLDVGGARSAAWLFLAGTVLFSGSLYALALTGARWLGAVTPVGGLLFLAGWAVLAYAGLKHP